MNNPKLIWAYEDIFSTLSNIYIMELFYEPKRRVIEVWQSCKCALLLHLILFSKLNKLYYFSTLKYSFSLKCTRNEWFFKRIGDPVINSNAQYWIYSTIFPIKGEYSSKSNGFIYDSWWLIVVLNIENIDQRYCTYLLYKYLLSVKEFELYLNDFIIDTLFNIKNNCLFSFHVKKKDLQNMWFEKCEY